MNDETVQAIRDGAHPLKVRARKLGVELEIREDFIEYCAEWVGENLRPDIQHQLSAYKADIKALLDYIDMFNLKKETK